ncbi:MAG: efflux RND transporter permease subunit [Planctomycetia bacterium]|nr:MAG: efflux RND transporter permease subunit [Planctomycetia bacterium]
MLERIIHWSLRNRLLVIVGALALVCWGAYSLAHLPVDAFPDTTPVLVQVNTAAPALSAEEIELQVTAPIERELGGTPGILEIRSVSRFGFCQVTAIFEDGTDVLRARQLVGERLPAVELPGGVERPRIGPLSSGLGEILHYAVVGRGQDLTELTTLQDWVIRPRLLGVPGVAEVNTWGGLRKQFQVLVDPVRLVKHGFSLDDLLDALRRSNLTVGGGNLAYGGELHVVQGVALTRDVREIGNVVVSARDGVPIRVADVADVVEGHELRRGGVTANGEGEIVHGLAFMTIGENAREVTQRLLDRIAEVRRELPAGVEIQVLYARSELVDQVIATVRKNLLEGALLVVAVLFAFLGSLRAGLIVALAIPLAMMCSFNAMLQVGIAASLLSLGAIDFGLVVDSSVIMVENSVRRLSLADPAIPSADVVRDACVEVRRPTMFGELIIMVVYMPILLLEGVEGRLFRPMALTVIFALGASLVLSMTLVPVLCAMFLGRRAAHREGRILRAAQSVVRPAVRGAVRLRWVTIPAACLLLAAGGWSSLRLGAEFVPRLGEMAITMNGIRLSGVSLGESLRVGTQIERMLLEEFPDEIRDVWSRTGTAEISTDPMGLEVTDLFITLQPRERWTQARTQSELTERIDAEIARFPGMNRVFSQPIEMRMNELLAGIRTDVGIKLFGPDLGELRSLALRAAEIAESVRGAADVSVEQLTGLPVLEIRVDQDAIARYGIPAEHVLEMVEAVGGIQVGQIREFDRRFDLVVRLDERSRGTPESIAAILVSTADGQRIPLSLLADVRQVEGPAAVNRESGRRRAIVSCNVRGRDLAGFVTELRRRLDAELSPPTGYNFEIGGQWEHLTRAAGRLAIIIPTALGIILLLLYLSTRSVADAMIIFTGAPFAALGGIVALALRDMPFTISAGVGFVAVSGVSVLNGLVLVAAIRRRLAEGAPIDEAIEHARSIRLRPILMTALVAALGFVPMALNTGIGAEVQRPLATVVIGGVIADNLLTLLVLPALFRAFAPTRRTSPAAA